WDGAFGSHGATQTAVGEASAASDLLLEPDGKIVAVGTTGRLWDPAAQTEFALVRYKATGSLDPSFGAGGIATTQFGPHPWAASAVRQPDGKIVVGGGTGKAFGLARYTSNGSLDPSFGSGGRTTISGDGATAVALQPDGKIVAVGSYGNRHGYELVRLRANGSVDPTFGEQGIVRTTFRKPNF